MSRSLLFTVVLSLAATAAGAQSASTPVQSTSPPAPSAAPSSTSLTLGDATVLIESPRAKLTKYDYDSELLRLTPDIRQGFSTDPNRVSSLVNNLWTTRVLAATARAQGIDGDADFKRRAASEMDRLLVAALVERIDAEVAREFDAKPTMEQFARERYLANPAKYQLPERVSATHILFEVPKHSSDEAKKLATEARARIVAGADMNALAKEISEDPSAKRNSGRLESFAASQMDPAFSRAAFALKKVGDISEQVESRFGWHVIRLDGRQPGGTRPFDEAKNDIIQEVRKAYIEERRRARIEELRNTPKPTVNDAAIDAMVIRADPEAIRKATEPKKP
jgi:peptidyl-prolyl cis-trans isomerase C